MRYCRLENSANVLWPKPIWLFVRLHQSNHVLRKKLPEDRKKHGKWCYAHPERRQKKKNYSKIRRKHPMSIWVRNLGELWLWTDSWSVNQCPSQTTERIEESKCNEQRTFLLASYWKEWVTKTTFTSTIVNLYLQSDWGVVPNPPLDSILLQ